MLLWVLAFLCLAGFIYYSTKLMVYYDDYRANAIQSEETREIYYAKRPTEQPPLNAPFSADLLLSTAENLPSNTEDSMGSTFIGPVESFTTLASNFTDQSKTWYAYEPKHYPNNPMMQIQPQFEKLVRRNKDIIGWLRIDDLIDEAVVQRDNIFYLKRDYLGYHNINGALFLDKNCDLSMRPDVLYIYGHNMKSGAMFGNLRYYQMLSYYKKNPFIGFDSLYENGKYVIFAVSDVAIDVYSKQFTGVFQLQHSASEQKQRALERLIEHSVFASGIDVSPEDQLLFLVTCTADDNIRNIVAARRIRMDETELDLAKLVQRSYLR